LVADVAGYWLPSNAVSAGRVVTLSPSRLLDTRDGTGAPKQKLGADKAIDLQVTGRGGVPADASAVVLNLTATDTSASGYFTVWPTGTARQLTSSLNVDGVNRTRANLVMVPLGAGGQVSIYTQSGANVVADVDGYVTGSTASPSTEGLFVAIPPARTFDTRKPGAGGMLPPQTVTTLTLAGFDNVPLVGAGGVVVNLTMTNTQAAGYLTAFPAGTAQPLASSVNASASGDTVPNLAMLQLGVQGAVDFFTQWATDLLVDVAGYFIG
jgi:hypothetical protein